MHHKLASAFSSPASSRWATGQRSWLGDLGLDGPWAILSELMPRRAGDGGTNSGFSRLVGRLIGEADRDASVLLPSSRGDSLREAIACLAASSFC